MFSSLHELFRGTFQSIQIYMHAYMCVYLCMYILSNIFIVNFYVEL